MYVIVGAGNFSYVHLNILSDLNVNDITILKKTLWHNDLKNQFINKYPSLNLKFENKISDYTDKIVHIVTPSNSHLAVLKKTENAQKVFVEKPSILFNKIDDFLDSNNIKGQIYQNDWLSQIQTYRINKNKPHKIIFKYDVKTKNNIDHITEIWSHVLNLMSLWINPNFSININLLELTPQTATLDAVIDNNLSVSIKTTNGKCENSQWSLIIDDEKFTSEYFKGKLLLATISDMINNKPAVTNWYKSAWIIHRFRSLMTTELFMDYYEKYYITNGQYNND